MPRKANWQQVFGSDSKTTDYVGELVFEDNALQFVLQPEGRVVADLEPGAPDPWEYQYFLKDHLGNTRVVFSEKTHATEYKATLEDDRQSEEMSMFFQYPAPGNRSAVNEFDHTDAGTVYTRSQLLTGSDNNRVGLSKSFEVNSGDVFDLEVYAKYEAPTGTPSDVNALFNALVNAFSLGAATSPLDGAPAYSAFEDVFAGGGPWINSSMWEEAPPKAYLNYLLFDENFVLVDGGFDQVSTDCEQESDLDPVAPHDYLSLHVKVEQKGYLYVYLSNEQAVLTNVYFDDMKIVQYSSVEQVSDYYPFGLTFNSYKRENSVDQKYLYNGGSELQDELSLSVYQTRFRMLEPATARWWQTDPKSADEELLRLSTYLYALNDPIRLNDPNGDCPPRTKCVDPVDKPEISDDNGGKNENRFESPRAGRASHKGVDIKAKKGTTLKSMMKGEVLDVNKSFKPGEYKTMSTGNFVVVRTKLPDGRIVDVKYGHLDGVKPSIEKGTKVEAGQAFASTGNTGNAAHIGEENYHVHIEASLDGKFYGSENRVDPENFMATEFDGAGNAKPRIAPVSDELEGLGGSF